MDWGTGATHFFQRAEFRDALAKRMSDGCGTGGGAEEEGEDGGSWNSPLRLARPKTLMFRRAELREALTNCMLDGRGLEPARGSARTRIYIAIHYEMKRIGQLIEAIAAPDNLRLAFCLDIFG